MSERRAKRPAPDETGAEAVSEDPEVEEEAIEVAPADAYEALVIDPPDEAEEPKPKVVVPEGHVRIVYRAAMPDGVLYHGDYKFRSDEPVTVPSDVAEELLTQPFEAFELLKGDPDGDA